MVLDGPHLGEAQIKLPGATQVHQRVVVHGADRHLDAVEVVGAALTEMVEREPAEDGLLDGVIGQDARDQARQGVGGALDAVRPDRPDVVGLQAEVAEQGPRAVGHRVGDARLGQDVDDGPGPSGSWSAGRIA